jgi:flagellar biosynthesis protein FliR
MDLNSWLGIASGRFVTGLYIFARFGGLFSAAPLVSSKSVPTSIRVGLSGIMALILMPLAAPSRVGTASAPGAVLVAGLGKELLLGLVLGWTATMFFACAQMAGEWLDLQSGFQASQLVNPTFDTHNAVLGNLNYWLAVLVFLGSGGYAILLRAAVRSFAVSPPGALRLNLGTAGDWTTLVAQVIWIALQLAAPVAAALFLAEIAVGFISRAMPQMNVMMLTLPAKSGLALGALALSIPMTARALEVAFSHMGAALACIVRGMER